MILGIYIHIPFCQAKCSYCHFTSMPLVDAREGRYQKALARELTCHDVCAGECSVDSIYFGGGTPSLIPAEHIAELLDCCRRRFPVAGDCETSLEANPGTLSEEKVQAYSDSGVNRISLGAQSFTDQELLSIGRLHTAEMIAEALSLLRKQKFANINLDLMLGLPGQTRDSWRQNLEMAARLKVPHLSVYMLDLDDQCPMQSLVDSGSIRLPEDDLVSDLYLETIEFLSKCGYMQYEISNFALPGYECRHNMKYWQRRPVYGFGLASHSFDGHSRYCNCSQIDQYIEAVNADRSPISWREPVSVQQSLSESLFLGLRLRQGVDWNQLQEVYGRERLAQYEPGMLDLSKKGLLEWIGSTVHLTRSGMLLSNEVFQLFV